LLDGHFGTARGRQLLETARVRESSLGRYLSAPGGVTRAVGPRVIATAHAQSRCERQLTRPVLVQGGRAGLDRRRVRSCRTRKWQGARLRPPHRAFHRAGLADDSHRPPSSRCDH